MGSANRGYALGLDDVEDWPNEPADLSGVARVTNRA
jgi:hypothetical protein